MASDQEDIDYAEGALPNDQIAVAEDVNVSVDDAAIVSTGDLPRASSSRYSSHRTSEDLPLPAPPTIHTGTRQRAGSGTTIPTLNLPEQIIPNPHEPATIHVPRDVLQDVPIAPGGTPVGNTAANSPLPIDPARLTMRLSRQFNVDGTFDSGLGSSLQVSQPNSRPEAQDSGTGSSPTGDDTGPPQRRLSQWTDPVMDRVRAMFSRSHITTSDPTSRRSTIDNGSPPEEPNGYTRDATRPSILRRALSRINIRDNGEASSPEGETSNSSPEGHDNGLPRTTETPVDQPNGTSRLRRTLTRPLTILTRSRQRQPGSFSSNVGSTPATVSPTTPASALRTPSWAERLFFHPSPTQDEHTTVPDEQDGSRTHEGGLPEVGKLKKIGRGALKQAKSVGDLYSRFMDIPMPDSCPPAPGPAASGALFVNYDNLFATGGASTTADNGVAPDEQQSQPQVASRLQTVQAAAGRRPTPRTFGDQVRQSSGDITQSFRNMARKEQNTIPR